MFSMGRKSCVWSKSINMFKKNLKKWKSWLLSLFSEYVYVVSTFIYFVCLSSEYVYQLSMFVFQVSTQDNPALQPIIDQLSQIQVEGIWWMEPFVQNHPSNNF